MKTELCEQWAKRDRRSLAQCAKISYYPFVMKNGSGSIVEDVDGNRFIDFLSSAACLNLGHAHPKIIQAVSEQMGQFSHYTTAYFYNTKAVEMAERLTEVTPGSFEKRVAFGMTGSDANDGAIKFARGFTGRNKIIAFKGAYHGATYGALSLTHISLNMRRKLGPAIDDVFAFDYPNTYLNGPDDAERCIKQIKEAFTSYLPPEEVAAVFIEPIQGDAGIVIPPKKFMQDLYALCREHGILFVSEEVQQGFCRTGKWFGIENFDIVPDIVILGKPMAGGMPLSAVVGRAEIMNSLDAPAHLFTFSGNPVSCAAGLATIEVLSEPGFLEAVNTKGTLIQERFKEMQGKYPVIGDVRGLGLSIAIELVEDRDKKTPDAKSAAKICYQAWRKGVILITLAGNVLRIQPPLIITEEEIRKALAILEECFDDLEAGNIPEEALDVIKGW